jgi:hypothetical protein
VIVWAYRTSHGGKTTVVTFAPAGAHVQEVELKISRSGNVLTPMWFDGSQWQTLQAGTSYSLPSDLFVGIALTSGTDRMFSDISIA